MVLLFVYISLYALTVDLRIGILELKLTLYPLKETEARACWKSWSPATRGTPRSLALSLTFRDGRGNCPNHFWQMPSGPDRPRCLHRNHW